MQKQSNECQVDFIETDSKLRCSFFDKLKLTTLLFCVTLVNKVMLFFLVVSFLFGCERKTQLNETIFEAGVIQGELDTKDLAEASGLAGSVGNPGLLWAHNDSDDNARIFLIDKEAHYKATVWFDRTTNRDWEDIAVGPGPVEGKNYIYVGDIGDNGFKHRYKFIYRIEEPVVDGDKIQDTTIVAVDKIKFQLPDSPRDAEAMMVDPLTRDIYLLSKREQKVNLYRLPFPQSTTEVMTAELALSKLEFNQHEERIVSKKDNQVLTNGYHSSYFNQIVSCDMSRDGNELLVKSYSSVYYWKREKDESVAELIKKAPIRLPYTSEPQGEAITFDVTGVGYFTLSERRGETSQRLFFYKRK